MLPVSFGAMLMESMLAIIALIAVASFADGEAAAQGLTTQPQIFAGAIANFLSVIGLPHSLVFTLINLAVSAFALTSLDSVARVGRLSFQEFFLDSDTDEENMNPFLKVMTNKYFATIITLVLAYLLTRVGRVLKNFWKNQRQKKQQNEHNNYGIKNDKKSEKTEMTLFFRIFLFPGDVSEFPLNLILRLHTVLHILPPMLLLHSMQHRTLPTSLRLVPLADSFPRQKKKMS